MRRSGLAGRRVLVVEDEALVAMLLEGMLQDMGCEVIGPAGQVDEALVLLESGADPDVALLDVNVAGQTVYPVAEVLKARGIPVVFSSGFGQDSLAESWHEYPSIQKPYSEPMVQQALEQALGIKNV